MISAYGKTYHQRLLICFAYCLIVNIFKVDVFLCPALGVHITSFAVYTQCGPLCDLYCILLVMQVFIFLLLVTCPHSG